MNPRQARKGLPKKKCVIDGFFLIVKAQVCQEGEEEGSERPKEEET
jgi:hypothetical protein